MSNYELQSKLKKSSTATICAFFGVHYLYLGKPGAFIFYLITGGGFGLWWFIDLFRAGGLADKHNEPIVQKMEMNDLKREMANK